MVCHYDVVCFDEVSGISFDQKDGVNIMKGYMAAGEFSRGKESIRASGSIVMVGNFDVDVEQQQRIGHLLSPLPPEMRNDTAFMDRIHAYVPGWDFPKLKAERAPDGPLRPGQRFPVRVLDEAARRHVGYRRLQGRAHWGGALSGRDIEAVNKTVSGLLKLLFPDPDMPIPDEDLEGIVRLALEARRRVKEQQKRCLKTRVPQHPLQLLHGRGWRGAVRLDAGAAQRRGHRGRPAAARTGLGDQPRRTRGGSSLYRIEATSGPGGGVKILNAPVPPAFRESVRYGEQNLYSRAKELVGDRDPRSHEFSVQLRAMDADRSGHGLGLPVLLALCGSLMERSTKGGLIVVGSLNLGGSVEMIPNPVAVAELAVEKGAAQLLMPISSRRQLLDLPDDMATKVNIVFYADPADAFMKAILE